MEIPFYPDRRICDSCKKIFPMQKVKPFYDWRTHKKLGQFCRDCKEEMKKKTSQEHVTELKSFKKTLMTSNVRFDLTKIIKKIQFSLDSTDTENYPLAIEYIKKLKKDLEEIEKSDRRTKYLEKRKILKSLSDEVLPFLIDENNFDKKLLTKHFGIAGKFIELPLPFASEESLETSQKILNSISKGNHDIESVMKDVGMHYETVGGYIRKLEESKQITSWESKGKKYFDVVHKK